jgi:F5/8 type C domain-containing protein
VGLSELEIWGPDDAALAAAAPPPPRDLAFNATATGYPHASASFTSAGDRVEQVNDLQVALTRYSRNRWTAGGSPNARDWVEIDFGEPKRVCTVELYLWGDGVRVRAPKSYSIQLWDGTGWRDARVRSRQPAQPLASARNVVTIDPARASRLRVILEHDLPAVSGITELIVLP